MPPLAEVMVGLKKQFCIIATNVPKPCGALTRFPVEGAVIKRLDSHPALRLLGRHRGSFREPAIPAIRRRGHHGNLHLPS
jgi:hypothetical protein